MTNFAKKVELLANGTIITVACLLAVILVKDHLLKKPVEQPATIRTPNQSFSGSQALSETKLSSLEVDWKQSSQTLVLAISASCHFCTDSAPFYQTLAQSKKDTRVVAVLPQSVEEGKSYLQKLGVSVDEIRQLPLNQIGVRGTPTLLLVDASGSVKNSWVGKLPPEKETDVLKHLQL